VPAQQEFIDQAAPFRAELIAHCYRMLGSVQDAEDLVQETYLRGWRGYEAFEERAALRTWLYRIATNACLTALESRGRRPLPSGLVAPNEDPSAPLVRGEATWLQPLPDALLGADPGKAAVDRGSLRLAFVAAVQHLSARQRATLILRDVLDFSAAESAEILGMSTPAVNSALQRARGQLRAAGVPEDEVAEPSEQEVRARIDRFVEAFERADVAAIKQLLTHDVLLEMPPMVNWFVGREHYGTFMDWVFSVCRDWRMVRTAANGQPALAAYWRVEGGAYRLHTLQVLTVTAAGISRNTVYTDSEVFTAFGLPEELAGIHPR
jgi:RNA polymerase sigma-70 factor (ECF subfamily)